MPFPMLNPPDHSTPATPTGSSVPRADADRLMLVCAMLSLAMIVLVVSHVRSRPVSGSIEEVGAVLDPDMAPWWELTALPEIGPVLAGEIVRYRDSQTIAARNDGARVFTEPGDLMKVHGIGPKTVERIKDDLTFGGD